MAVKKWEISSYGQNSWAAYVIDGATAGYISNGLPGDYTAEVYPKDGGTQTVADNVSESAAMKAVEEYWADKHPYERTGLYYPKAV